MPACTTQSSSHCATIFFPSVSITLRLCSSCATRSSVSAEQSSAEPTQIIAELDEHAAEKLENARIVVASQQVRAELHYFLVEHDAHERLGGNLQNPLQRANAVRADGHGLRIRGCRHQHGRHRAVVHHPLRHLLYR